MKKRVFVIAAVVALMAVSVSYAGDDITAGPIKKLGRGLANVVTSPFELPKGMGAANEESGMFAGLTWGVLQGTVNIVKRAAVGVYEVATFPIPLPGDYKPIIDDPEFILDDDPKY